mgnify:CR=1 FL=1|jgi:hypothetical protein
MTFAPALLRLDVLFESVSLAIGLAIASTALVAYRRVGSRTLLLLSLGFFITSFAMLFRVLIVAWALSELPWRGPLGGFYPISLIRLQEFVYSIVRLSGYLVFLYLYATYPLTRERIVTGLAPAGIGLIYSPLFEATAALILGYIVYQLSRVNRSGVSPYTGYVFLGFIMLLASHLLFLATPLSLLFYLAAHTLQMFSFLLLLASMLTVLLHGKRLQI